jgi:hypothetical protein
VNREALAREGRRRQALEVLEFERARGTALRERLEMFVTEIDGPAVDETVFASMSPEDVAVVRAELQPVEPVPPDEPDETYDGEPREGEPEPDAEPVEVLHAAELDRLQREIAASQERQRAFERYLELLDGVESA